MRDAAWRGSQRLGNRPPRMNPKAPWFWMLVAAALLAVILVHRRPGPASAAGPEKLLPKLKLALVTGVQVRPRGQLTAIRAERTKVGWQLTRPVLYPARAASIESLLAALEHLTPVAVISAGERQNHPKADEEDGFSPPQSAITISLEGTDVQVQLDIGAKTAPGDQVFLQVVGDPAVYVVDADWLQFVPATKDD